MTENLIFKLKQMLIACFPLVLDFYLRLCRLAIQNRTVQIHLLFLTKQQWRLIQKNQVTVGLIQLATHSFWAEWDRFFSVFVFFFRINFRIIRTSVFQLYRVVEKQCAQINRITQVQKTSPTLTGTLEKSGFPVPSCLQNLCYSDAATHLNWEF